MHRRIYFGILLLLFTLSIVSLWQCAGHDHKQEIPGLNTGYYLNHNDTVKYVGMNVCRECHPLIYDSFIKTGMGLSFDSATRSKSSSILNSRSLVEDKFKNLNYHPYWDNDTLKVKEFRIVNSDTVFERVEKVSFIVGSGHHTNSHMFETNAYVHQIPFTFYTQDTILDFPPGFEDGFNSRFGRKIGLECMSCHNAYPDFVLGSENKYNSIPRGIDCERCHGPGEVHVKYKKAGILIDTAKYIDYSIVNPAKLSPELQMDLCARCHLQGTMVLKPGKSFFDFKPGMKLTEVLDVFMPLFEGGKEDFIMASHTERMKESKCYLGSEDKFNCLSCHNPHVSTKFTEMASYNKVCLDCHIPNKNSCTLPEGKRLEEKNGCVGCHMPEGGSRDIPHERNHDHKIAIPKTAEQLKEKRVFKGLIAVNNHNTDSLTMARGYLQEFETYHADEHYLDSAYSYLNYRENKNNPSHFNAIVNYYFLKKDYPLLMSFVEEKGIQDVLNDYLNEQDYSNYDAWTSYRIGQAYESDANLMIADYFYKNAISLAKYNLEFQNKYGSLLTKMKKIPEAKKVFQFVVSEYPKFASAHVNLGYVFALGGDFSNAELHYKKALALNPDNITGLINYSTLLMNQGKYEDAKKLAVRALAIEADNAQVRLLLLKIDKRKGGK